MTGDDDDSFDMDLDMPTEAPAPPLTERDEIIAENAPEAREITDVDFHELDLP
jgi:hypothetical protein